MPKSFKDHQSRSSTKVLLTAPNGAGKSTALATLANAGQRLIIFDFDNGLDTMKAHINDDAWDRIFYETLRDTPGNIHAFDTYKSLLWKGFKVDGVDLGSAKTWGPDTTIVIDSATFMTDAVKYALLDRGETAKDGRKIARPMNDQLTMPDWGELVRDLEWEIAQLTSDTIKANVVITAVNLGIEDQSGVDREYPNIGTKNFSREVGGYFNNVVSIRDKRDGTKVLRTQSDNRQSLKTANSKAVPAELPVDLAALFELLQKGKAA